MKRYLALFSALLFGACLYAQGTAAAEEQLPVPSAAQASDHFDPLAATNAYLAIVPPDKKALRRLFRRRLLASALGLPGSGRSVFSPAFHGMVGPHARRCRTVSGAPDPPARAHSTWVENRVGGNGYLAGELIANSIT